MRSGVGGQVAPAMEAGMNPINWGQRCASFGSDFSKPASRWSVSIDQLLASCAWIEAQKIALRAPSVYRSNINEHLLVACIIPRDGRRPAPAPVPLEVRAMIHKRDFEPCLNLHPRSKRCRTRGFAS